jgi:hypothetical protein
MTDKIRRKDKVEVHTRTGYKGPEVEHRYSSTLSLNSPLDMLVG